MKLLALATVATFAIAMLTGPALAADPQPAGAGGVVVAPATVTPPADKSNLKPKEKRICTEVQPIGSKVPRRVCKTVEVSEEEHYYGKEARQRMMEGGALPTTPGGGGN